MPISLCSGVSAWWKAYFHNWLYRSTEWLDGQGPALDGMSQRFDS